MIFQFTSVWGVYRMREYSIVSGEALLIKATVCYEHEYDFTMVCECVHGCARAGLSGYHPVAGRADAGGAHHLG